MYWSWRLSRIRAGELLPLARGLAHQTWLLKVELVERKLLLLDEKQLLLGKVRRLLSLYVDVLE